MQNPQSYRTSRTAVALMAAASAMPVVTTVANAGEAGYGYSSLAQREMIRRQNDVAEADRLLLEGRQAFASGDFQQAVDKYSQAIQKLPETAMFADRRQSYIEHLADASVALSMQHRKVGKYTEARTLLDNVLSVDPNNALAKRELGYLDDPIRTNPALTYEHTQNVDQVRRSLYTAEGSFNLGKYDDANREYQEVLRVDPYNSAARRGMEQVAAAKSDYYRAAYDQTRAELLSQVDAAWELTVPAEAPDLPFGPNTNNADDGVAYITAKLRRIIIPSIDFEDTSLEEAIDFLRLRSAELDTLELDPARKGVNFVINRPREATTGTPDAGVDAGGAGGLPLGASDPSSLRIRELRLRNVPLEVALKYIADATRLRVKVDNFAVKLVSQSESGEDIFTRTFTVPPDFATSLDSSAGGGAGGEGTADPFAEESSGSKITARRPVIDLLKASGVNFGEGTSATLSSGGVLLVTNTPSELDKVEQIVNALINKQPKQVKITTKFVEITQENSEELGFDWVLGPFALNSEDSLLGSGGSIGNGTPRNGSDFSTSVPLVPGVPGLPINPAQTVSNIVTGGNRSGDGAIVGNSVDAILNNPNRATQASNVAPGILSLTGIFTDGQFQMMMRGVSQKKGVDLMTAPSITARSGQKATIEIIREFIYPTEYEPPEVPQGGGGDNGFVAPIVTPATPTAFETRNTGITLEIEPNIGENDFMIDLRFVPEIVEFEGFINYGSPIQASTQESVTSRIFDPILGIFDIVTTTVPRTVTLTENRIEMPVFATRRVNSAITIYDGYTVAIGGLMREDVQDVEDKVPILGDIPFIGRLFQTDADKRIKSNLVIFVTAQIIDATGRPLRGADAGATIPTAIGGGGAENLDGVLPPL